MTTVGDSEDLRGGKGLVGKGVSRSLVGDRAFSTAGNIPAGGVDFPSATTVALV